MKRFHKPKPSATAERFKRWITVFRLASAIGHAAKVLWPVLLYAGHCLGSAVHHWPF